MSESACPCVADGSQTKTATQPEGGRGRRGYADQQQHQPPEYEYVRRRPRHAGIADGGLVIGAGTLAIPLALSHFGILPGVLLIVWCGVTSAFGLYLQSRCARYLERGSSSFFALSQMTYPNAAVFFDAAIAIKCFGVGVSYMIIIGDLMPGVVLGFASDESRVLAFLLDRQFWITAFMLFIIPLSFLKRLDSLKYTSVTALVAIGYLMVLVVYHFAADPVPKDRGNIHWVSWAGPVSALGSLPVIIFAYTCHQNVGALYLGCEAMLTAADVFHSQRDQGQLAQEHCGRRCIQHWIGCFRVHLGGRHGLPDVRRRDCGKRGPHV